MVWVLVAASVAVAVHTGTDAAAAAVVVVVGTSGTVAIGVSVVHASKVVGPAGVASCCESGTDPTDQPGSDLAVERAQFFEAVTTCSND